jgi:ABC-type branched-subunit amino acid transport system ATPase component
VARPLTAVPLLATARALATRPSPLLLGEPAAGVAEIHAYPAVTCLRRAVAQAAPSAR